MVKSNKVVIDTNIFISAFGWGGKPFEIIELLESAGIVNCISEDIILEVSRALAYPKLDFPQKLQSDILEFIKGKEEYIKAVQAGMSRNYEPMEKIFTTVTCRTLRLHERR